jgi:hypothetical protein
VHVTSVADPARVPWRVREVGTKSATSVTTQDRQHPADRSRARSLTLAAYVVNLGYLVWFWVMFIGGYWVASWFGIDPVEESITDQGVLGWLAAFGLGVVSAVPSLVGAFLAGPPSAAAPPLRSFSVQATAQVLGSIPLGVRDWLSGGTRA